MSELPPGWDWATPDELAATISNALTIGPFGSDLKVADYRDAGVPLVFVREIRARRFGDAKTKYVDERKAAALSRHYVRPFDVLITKMGDPPGDTALYPADRPAAIITADCIKLTPNLSVTTPNYLVNCLRSEPVRSQILERAAGVAQQKVSLERFRTVRVPLAPLLEQKRIADKLDALLTLVDACRERLDRVPSIIRRFRQSILAVATSGELTREWREARGLDESPEVDLERVAGDFSYGTSAKSSKSGMIPVLRMGNIQDGLLEWEDLVFTSDSAEIAKYRLSPGDVLFNRTNSPELVGKAAVFRGEREAIYAGYLIRVRCGERLLPDYLNYCLGSPAGREYCWRVKSDGVSQSNINARKLAAFTFRLPTVAEQEEIVRRVEELLSLSRALQARAEAATQRAEGLTTSALAKAFRGELVPQDPDDEPASELLARVRIGPAAPGSTNRPKRGGSRGAGSKAKVDTNMLTRKDIAPTHLTNILQERGALTPEALWKVSQLEIDEFYAQLKDEESRGLLRENRGDSSDGPRLLEPAA